ncbi:MAG: calcium-binding protein [Hyphomicrobiaceae bacterium]
MGSWTRTDTPISTGQFWGDVLQWLVDDSTGLPNQIIIEYSDGTFGEINGTGLALDGSNVPTAGTMTSLRRLDTDGVTLLEEITGISVSLVALYNSLDPAGLILAGDDTVTGGTQDDIMGGAGGDDTISGNGGNDTLFGGDGGDTINGGAGVDTIYGEEGNDTIQGGGGGDILDGGNGFDILNYFASTSAVTINLSTNAASGGHATGDTISNFEAVYGSAHNDDLTGGSGNERFRGRDGSDTIDGGDGFDEADFFDSPAGVTLTFTGGGGVTVADDGYGNAETYSNIEAVRGSQHADTLTGDDENERFRGMAGDDVINGGGGDNDLIDYSLDEVLGKLCR